jgi:ribonuclease-3
MSWLDQLRSLVSTNGKPLPPADLRSLIRREFGLRVKNESIYREALTHASMLDGDTTGMRSNERLEFLGDVALDLSVASSLFDEFPDEQEGGLTQRKSKVVNRKTLNLLGERMGLPALIEAKMRREDIRDTVVGNAVEALIGAVYLDHGFNKTSKAVIRLLKRHGAYDKVHSREDFKSQLHKWAAKQRRELVFQVIREGREGGEEAYEIAAVVSGKELGRGTGSSKKSAEQMAARHAWKRVYTAKARKERESSKTPSSASSSRSEDEVKNENIDRPRRESSGRRRGPSRRSEDKKPVEQSESRSEGTKTDGQSNARRRRRPANRQQPGEATATGNAGADKPTDASPKVPQGSGNRRRRGPRKPRPSGDGAGSEKNS